MTNLVEFKPFKIYVDCDAEGNIVNPKSWIDEETIRGLVEVNYNINLPAGYFIVNSGKLSSKRVYIIKAVGLYKIILTGGISATINLWVIRQE